MTAVKKLHTSLSIALAAADSKRTRVINIIQDDDDWRPQRG